MQRCYRPKPAAPHQTDLAASGTAHVLCESLLPLRMPARQSRSIFDEVAGGPGDPLLIDCPSGFVVGTQEIKVAGGDMVEHEVDHLLRRPRAGGLFGCPCQAGEREAGYEKMRSHAPFGLLP